MADPHPPWQYDLAERQWDYAVYRMADAIQAAQHGDHTMAGQHFRSAFLAGGFYASTLGMVAPDLTMTYEFPIEDGDDLDLDDGEL